MKEVIQALTKQKQLLEIELGEAAKNQKAKRPNIHTDMYYVKLDHAYKAIVKSIQMLRSASKDVYEGVPFPKQ